MLKFKLIILKCFQSCIIHKHKKFSSVVNYMPENFFFLFKDLKFLGKKCYNRLREVGSKTINRFELQL